MIHKLFDPLARRWHWVATTLRVQDRFNEVHGSYLAAAVTLTSFLSLFPLLLVTVAVVGFVSEGASDLPGEIIGRLGLTGDAATAVVAAIHKAEESRRVASAVGLVGLMWAGLGVVAALQYALDTVWQVPGRGLRDKAFGLAWLAGSVVIFALSAALGVLLNFLPPVLAPAAVVAGIGVNIALWMWTLRVLPNHAVPWRNLIPGAVFGGVGLEVLKVVGAVYVPRVVASSSALYGTIGVVFAVLAWLLVFGRLVVYASVLNVVRWEEDHGTVSVEIEMPRLPGEVPVSATRAGEAQDADASQTA